MDLLVQYGLSSTFIRWIAAVPLERTVIMQF